MMYNNLGSWENINKSKEVIIITPNKCWRKVHYSMKDVSISILVKKNLDFSIHQSFLKILFKQMKTNISSVMKIKIQFSFSTRKYVWFNFGNYLQGEASDAVFLWSNNIYKPKIIMNKIKPPLISSFILISGGFHIIY